MTASNGRLPPLKTPGEISKVGASQARIVTVGRNMLKEAYITGCALKHFEAEKNRPSDFSGLEDSEESGAGGDDDGTVIDHQASRSSGRSGRPKSAIAAKVRRRITVLVTDARQELHDDPADLLTAVEMGIRELEALREEIGDYLADG